MQFESLLKDLGDLPWFDLQTVTQLYSEPRQSILTQLHRWCASGKLIPLRRGMYSFGSPYARTTVNPAELAGALLAPSYLSTYWALGFLGIIPERVVTFTSVTPRSPRRFENAFGTFTYRHVKQDTFFGYRPVVVDGHRVLLAEPEKALVDHWYLEPGPWNEDRFEGMRFQNVELVDPDKLRRFAERTGSRRAMVAAHLWSESIAGRQEGGIAL